MEDVPGEFNLGVGKGSLGDADGDAEELAGLVVGDDAGVFSGSLEVKGVLDLSEELIDEVDDSMGCNKKKGTCQEHLGRQVVGTWR